MEVNYQEEGTGVGGYAKVMSEGYQKAQREMIARQCMDVDIVITTALIPGKPAPKLITAGMVESMKPGSVIVDLAAEQGGNCELTVPGEVAVRHGVTIIGYTDLPSRLARQSSTLYATNLLRLMEELCPNKDGTINVNMEDEVIRGTTVIKEGEITWPPPPPKISAAPAGATPAPPVEIKKAEKKPLLPAWAKTGITLGVAGLLFYGLGAVAPAAFMSHFTVFVLACFVGYMVIWNVTPALHTPLQASPTPFRASSHRRIDPDFLARCIDHHIGGARHRADLGQHGRRFLGHPAHAAHVQKISGENNNVRRVSYRFLYRLDDTIHPEPGGAVPSRNRAARQLLRHPRHEHRHPGDRVRA